MGNLICSSLGVVLSVSQSRLKLPTQVSFLVCSSLGIAVGTVYNSKTPNLYENNAHHGLGWVVTWVVVAQMLMGVVTAYAGHGRGNIATHDEHESLLPVSIEAMAKQHQLHAVPQAHGYRCSNDSGQGTEMPSSSSGSPSLSSIEEANDPRSIGSRRSLYDLSDDDPNGSMDEKQGPLHGRRIYRVLLQRVSGLLSARLLGLIDLINNGLDRIILVLGFVAIITGISTYYGLFVSSF